MLMMRMFRGRVHRKRLWVYRLFKAQTVHLFRLGNAIIECSNNRYIIRASFSRVGR